jgi:transcriptional regulator with XRE-family HTH domain
MRAHALRGDRLRQEREKRGLGKQELGRRIQTGPNQISRYETGEADPSPYQLKRIAQELEVTTDYLLGLVDKPDEHLREPELTLDERQLLTAFREGRLATLLRIINRAIPDPDEEADVTRRGVAPDAQPLESAQRTVEG